MNVACSKIHGSQALLAAKLFTMCALISWKNNFLAFKTLNLVKRVVRDLERSHLFDLFLLLAQKTLLHEIVKNFKGFFYNFIFEFWREVKDPFGTLVTL